MKKIVSILLSNRQKLENYLAFVVTVIILTFIIFWANNLYFLAFKSNDNDFTKTVVASFAGAFFAFLFLRVGEILEKYYQRQLIHFNALVSMEVSLDELGTIIHDNIYLLPSFRTTINSGNVYASTLRPLPIRRDYYEKLHDVELINELYKLNYDIRRINNDLESANDWYSHIREIYTTGQMKADHYIENAKILSENLKLLQAALILLLDDTIRFHAVVKIRLSMDKPLLTRIMHFIIDKTRQKIVEKQIKAKITQLKEEVEKSAEDSQPRIEKIRKMAEELS